MKELVENSYFILVPLFFFLVFFINWKIERRRIVNGLLFNLFLGSLYLFSIAMLGIGASSGSILLLIPGLLITVFIVLTALLGIQALIVFSFWNARQVLKRESRALPNMLTLFLGIFLTVFYLLQILPFNYPSFILAIFQWINFLGFYFFVVFANYLTVNLLYQLNRPKLNQDYIIVLGAGLIDGKKVSPLLASRIDRALAFYHKQIAKKQKVPTLIMSGGKGNDENLSEAEAMGAYAKEKGIPKENILLETNSVNTLQNMTFSKQLILERTSENYRGIFVSSNYHIFRASLDALAVDLNFNGIGSKTAFYFLPNAFLREFAAILVKNKRRHLLVVALITFLVFSMEILQLFN